MNLKEKKVVITGGGGGIGRSASFLFAEYGAEVIILEYNEESGKNVEAEIQAKGQKAWFIKTDISSLDSVKAAFAKIKEKYGSIDALYNNASVFLGGKDTSIDKLEEDVWDKVLSINLNGLYYCSKQAVNLMKENGGSIVNTASSAGVVGIPCSTAYTATKGATVSLTRSMAADLGSTTGSRGMYEDIDAGLITRMSWAFMPDWNSIEDVYDEENKRLTSTIHKVYRIYDVSCVSLPADPNTEISARSYFDGAIKRIEAERLQSVLEAQKATELRRKRMAMRAKAIQLQK